MRLRNGKLKFNPPPRDGQPEAGCYVPLVHPVRLHREVRALGLVNPRSGELRTRYDRPEVIPQNSLEDTFHHDERFCSAFLQKPEGLRQCKNKPLRNSDRCRHHNILTCTAAVREKLIHVAAVRGRMRQEIRRGQRQERQAEQNARRFRPM
ncbi:hypothetical protein PoB_006571300 [Plakobranchus ocellatus]|uniref:Uncharacterized protein n=1 Tax=Plakobranchus ocellatus TaxID=259542 RepID=A0AAV4D4R7_9GAST|nr:hypothetical protein PoB_006571300 [Plakobranchus ocellatus]